MKEKKSKLLAFLLGVIVAYRLVPWCIHLGYWIIIGLLIIGGLKVW